MCVFESEDLFRASKVSEKPKELAVKKPIAKSKSVPTRKKAPGTVKPVASKKAGSVAPAAEPAAPATVREKTGKRAPKKPVSKEPWVEEAALKLHSVVTMQGGKGSDMVSWPRLHSAHGAVGWGDSRAGRKMEGCPYACLFCLSPALCIEPSVDGTVQGKGLNV